MVFRWSFDDTTGKFEMLQSTDVDEQIVDVALGPDAIFVAHLDRVEVRSSKDFRPTLGIIETGAPARLRLDHQLEQLVIATERNVRIVDSKTLDELYAFPNGSR